MHKWTEQQDEILRVNYKQTHRSAMEIGIDLGIPWGVVRGRVAILGLSKRTGRISKRYWTPREDALLRELIHQFALPTVAHKLHRSIFSVKVHATRLKLHLRSRDGWYTKKEVCEILGVEHKRVQSYIDGGLLKASYHNGHKPQKNGMSIWHIDRKDLQSFIRKYCQEFTGRNVDLTQIVDILVGVEI
jgi:DNA-binding CsgD family transcriptional regulator